MADNKAIPGIGERSARHSRRFWIVTGVLLAVLTTLVLLHLAFGRTPLSLEEIMAALSGNGPDGHRHIVWNLRLPRALVAMTAGGLLGLAGAILQVVMRNPLMEPGLIGVSAGAVLAVILTMQFSTAAIPINGRMPIVALGGALLSIGMLYMINGRTGGSGPRLALIGVVAASVLQAANSLLMLRQQEGLASILLWSFGSLNGRVWAHWNMIWPWALALVPCALLMARRAAVLQLGDETAVGLGLPLFRTRLLLLLLAAALTAVSVSAVGAIGFAGLIGPHIAAKLVGRHPVYLFPASVLLAGTLLIAADWIAGSATLSFSLPGMEHRVTSLPAGAVTTLLGAPFFLYLLRGSLAGKRGI
ncbi:ABC transporter permease [Paenibacillus sp. MY03]|uniref:FecCD family ABC transporter permease n=1 Tax=Paenibacillus sp. MY03 TaxID=302980 RepID=UPI000B3BF7B7|nr:iron ABC transporter permease [Paenibacillus sp. MY03]OUS78439.1 ABC transporter permease [Paenibacillus sp. MY03]